MADTSPATGPDAPAADIGSRADTARQRAILQTGALQGAMLRSANFSCIATDERGVIYNLLADRWELSTDTDVNYMVLGEPGKQA